MAVREAVTVLGTTLRYVTCRLCGCAATVHPVNRITADGVTFNRTVTVCHNPACEASIG